MILKMTLTKKPTFWWGRITTWHLQSKSCAKVKQSNIFMTMIRIADCNNWLLWKKKNGIDDFHWKYDRIADYFCFATFLSLSERYFFLLKNQTCFGLEFSCWWFLLLIFGNLSILLEDPFKISKSLLQFSLCLELFYFNIIQFFFFEDLLSIHQSPLIQFCDSIHWTFHWVEELRVSC